MREIKFRAFIKHIGWVVPVEQINFDVKTVEVDLSSGQGDTSEYNFDEIELMQYTGIEDKRGVGIYEGDIVKHLGNMTGRVYYNEAETSFILEPVDSMSSYEVLGLQCELEVIGNQFENPELLEGENDETI